MKKQTAYSTMNQDLTENWRNGHFESEYLPEMIAYVQDESIPQEEREKAISFTTELAYEEDRYSNSESRREARNSTYINYLEIKGFEEFLKQTGNVASTKKGIKKFKLQMKDELLYLLQSPLRHMPLATLIPLAVQHTEERTNTVLSPCVTINPTELLLDLDSKGLTETTYWNLQGPVAAATTITTKGKRYLKEKEVETNTKKRG